MKRVKFTGFGSNSAFGGFGPGDFATVSDELAVHLVDEAKVARYADNQPAPVEAAKETQKAPVRAAKKQAAA